MLAQIKKFFKRISLANAAIRTQLLVGSGIIVALLIITAIVLSVQSSRIIDRMNKLQLTQVQTLAALDISADSTLISSSINRLAPLRDKNTIKQEVGKAYNSLRADRDVLNVIVQNMSQEDPLYPHVLQLTVLADEMIDITDKALRSAEIDAWPNVRARAVQLAQQQHNISQETQQFVEVAKTVQSEKVLDIRAARGRELVMIAFILLLAIGVAVVITRRMLSWVARPIAELTAVATDVAAGNLNQHVTVHVGNEVGQLARAFNTMTQRLRELVNTLEYRIQERTRALEVSMEISSQITMLQDRQSLLRYVVERIHHGYDLYHTHIFLVDPETDELVLAAGYGDVAEQMLAENYRLERGKGLIGTVAATNKPFLSNNVLDLLNYVPHPLLPNTRSELAVPLRVGNRVVGVLDIQSDREERFKPEDMTLMQSLADQTAVALQNIQLLEEMRETLKQVERLNRRLTQSTWAEFGDEVSTTGFRYRGGRRTTITPESDAWLPLMGLAANRKKLVRQRTESNGKYQRDELAVPLKLRGEIIGYLGITRDEASGWLEEEVEAVETVATQISMALENARLSHEQEKTIVRLRDVDKLKSNFLTSMSHELRTPLNSIIGFADILLQGIDGELSENAITDITAIHNSGKHLLALINDILDMSKIEAGRMELAKNAIEVPQLFEDVSASVSSLLKDKPVELQQRFAPDLPPIWADPLRISQVLINLVSNAIKFTEEGSVTLGAEMFGNKLMHIYVSDTGIGIPKDKFDLVFEHFRQVDARSNRKYQGTGMGLAISKQLVELHGGEMWLESEEGVGSTFHFTVPLAETAETPQLEPEPSIGETSN